MTKNPYANALIAGLYIVFVVFLIKYGPMFVREKPDTIFAPIAMLSLLVFSVAFMAYIFFLQPVLLYVEGSKHEAIAFFTRTLVTFAVMTVIVVATTFSL